MKKIDVIIPCLNEEKILNVSINTLRDFLKKNMKGYKYNITIADNGSKDQTFEIAKQLSKQPTTLCCVWFCRFTHNYPKRCLQTISLADSDVSLPNH